MDRRIKYYAIQAAALVLSGIVLAVALLAGDGWGLWCAVLPVCAAIWGAGWWLSRRFAAETSRHLTPAEWEELRGALEDVPVLSVLHLFAQDKRRLERFRYIPLLKQTLWEALAEDEVDVDRVARVAFLLHTFNQDLSEYAEAFPVVTDPVVLAWLLDMAAEPRKLVERRHLRQQLGRVGGLLGELGTGVPGIDEPNEDPGVAAAWRVMLFGPLAYTQVRDALGHDDPRVREAALALMVLQESWPTRQQDLNRMVRGDEDAAVRRAALEIVALDGERSLGLIRQCVSDQALGERARELVKELGS